MQSLHVFSILQIETHEYTKAGLSNLNQPRAAHLSVRS